MTLSAHTASGVPVVTRSRPRLSAKATRISQPVVPSINRKQPTLSELGIPYRRVETIRMSPEEWDKIARNPRQRDEIVRIEKGRIAHILDPNEKHREVAMGTLPDGRRYKVDGHTRSAAWRMGLVEAPSYLIVDVYECADEAAVEKLYDQFDSSFATETGTDRVTGAYSEAGIKPKSQMLREGGISTAARSLYHYVTQTAPKKETKHIAINRCVRMFADEIMLLDSINPSRILFPTGIIMGALITLAENPDEATEFWSAYMADAGWKEDGRVDAIQALRERHNQLRGKSNGARDNAFMAYSVAAFQGHMKGQTYTSTHLISGKSKDSLRRYVNKIVEAKGGK